MTAAAHLAIGAALGIWWAGRGFGEGGADELYRRAGLAALAGVAGALYVVSRGSR